MPEKIELIEDTEAVELATRPESAKSRRAKRWIKAKFSVGYIKIRYYGLAIRDARSAAAGEEIGEKRTPVFSKLSSKYIGTTPLFALAQRINSSVSLE